MRIVSLQASVMLSSSLYGKEYGRWTRSRDDDSEDLAAGVPATPE